MTERYGRSNQTDRDRGRDQDWQSPRQQQQFHNENAGQFGSSGQYGGYDDDTRNRGWESQQGGQYGSYGGEQDRYARSQYDEGGSGRSRYAQRDSGRAGGYGREVDWDRGYGQTGRFERNESRYGGNQDYRSYGGGCYGETGYGYGSGGYGGYGGNERGRFESFTGNDFGGRDFTRGSNALYGSTYGGSYGRPSDRSDYGGWRDYGEQRGFLDRAGDEIASWFGDDDAARRRRQDHSGRGPEGYTRSDERIREDVNDALTRDWAVDASKITVKVQNGEVTLDGTVPSRTAKRKAEDCADDVSGVKHVQNNLRVQEHDYQSTTQSTGTSSATTGSVTTSDPTSTTRTTR